MTTTHHEVATDSIDDLIGEAFDAGSAMPPHERLVEIDNRLRDEIDRLVTYAQRLADRVAYRSRQWYALVQAIDRAEDRLQFQLSATPLAGALHVAELARRVHELRAAGGVS